MQDRREEEQEEGRTGEKKNGSKAGNERGRTGGRQDRYRGQDMREECYMRQVGCEKGRIGSRQDRRMACQGKGWIRVREGRTVEKVN